MLPNRGRELLGLPTYRDRDLLVSHYFETLLKGAREVHLFYVESDTKERSRFIEKLLWEREKKRGSRNEHDPARQITYRINNHNSDWRHEVRGEATKSTPEAMPADKLKTSARTMVQLTQRLAGAPFPFLLAGAWNQPSPLLKSVTLACLWSDRKDATAGRSLL